MPTIRELKSELAILRQELTNKEEKFKVSKYSLLEKPIAFLKEDIRDLETIIIDEENRIIDEMIS